MVSVAEIAEKALPAFHIVKFSIGHYHHFTTLTLLNSRAG